MTTPVLGFDNDLHVGTDAGSADAVLVAGKDPGAYANQVEVEVKPPTSGEPDTFNIAVIEDGVYRELFINLTMAPDADRYIETVVNDTRAGSAYVIVADQLLAGQPVPDIQTAALAGGGDGLTGLDDIDFIGSEAGKTGMYALDQVQDVSLLFVPGRATPAVHNAMLQ
ncbi:MAG: phage tail protein, partial [Deltaproteobacteria bacterium]|nr:phage tail protein [Deltaproteobacteria bacterium]